MSRTAKLAVLAALATLQGTQGNNDFLRRRDGSSLVLDTERFEAGKSVALGDPDGTEEGTFDAVYEMITVYEEAFYEKTTLCETDSNKASLTGMGFGEGEALKQVPVVSVGSSSTQAYTCKEFGVGFYSGWQAESSNANEVAKVAAWMVEDSSEDEKTLLLCGGAGRNIPDAALQADKEVAQVFPKEGNYIQVSDIAAGKFQNQMKTLIEDYQEALVAKRYPGKLLMLNKKDEAKFKISNGWDKALVKEASITQGKKILDWGGSGPKVDGTNAMDDYNNKGLVNVDGDKKLDCAKLEAAIRGVLKELHTHYPDDAHFIAQTGLAREKWWLKQTTEGEGCGFVIKKFEGKEGKILKLATPIKLRAVGRDKLRETIIPKSKIPKAKMFFQASWNRTQVLDLGPNFF